MLSQGDIVIFNGLRAEVLGFMNESRASVGACVCEIRVLIRVIIDDQQLDPRIVWPDVVQAQR